MGMVFEIGILREALQGIRKAKMKVRIDQYLSEDEQVEILEGLNIAEMVHMSLIATMHEQQQVVSGKGIIKGTKTPKEILDQLREKSPKDSTVILPD